MFMRFRGGGVGHHSTRDATNTLLFDRPYEELQNIDTLGDFVEDEPEDIAKEEIAEGEPPEDIREDEPEDGAEGELINNGEHELDDESQEGSEDLGEEGVDYDDM